jgi:alkylation response protein AidB-like acyl-CoA dehydrogenase
MPRTGTEHWIHRARELATGVFAPAAMGVEASQRVPPEHLDLLAAEGFYGLAGPREAGGLDVPLAAADQIIEILAGACLSTTFVWTQHHGVVRAVAETANGALRQAMLGPLCRGERRAGVALAGLLPGPPRLRARPAEGGYVLDGTSPWVTGWRYIDTLYVAARREDDTIVWAVLDAGGGPGRATPTITAEPLDMVAAMASSTVELSFTGHPVPGRAGDHYPAPGPVAQPGRGRPALERLTGARPGRAVQ